MKKQLLMLLFAGLTIVSCNKTTTTPAANNNNNQPQTPTIPADGWMLGTTKYTTVVAARSGTKILSAYDGTPQGSNPAVNTLNVYFNQHPTADGKYKIVKYAGGVQLAANEIGIAAGVNSTKKTYASMGNDNIEATITINNSKIKVTIPEVWVQATGGQDSMKLTGTLQEQ